MKKYCISMLFVLGIIPVVWGQTPWKMAAKISQAAGAAVPEMTNRISREVSRAAYAAARAQFTGPSELLQVLPKSIVQISRPGHEEVLGTGIIVNLYKKNWVLTPYHIGGVKGAKRTIRIYRAEGEPIEHEITIIANGNAGWHAPDVSMARLPAFLSPEVSPLRIGVPDLTKPAYSIGYTAGNFSGEDILPMERRIFSDEGFGLVASRVIPGENPENPLNISGYCGSPVMQKNMYGEWRVVGMHTGSFQPGGGLDKNRSFATNLSRTLPLLFDTYFHMNVLFPRTLAFRGWELGHLKVSERVQKVQVIRNGEVVLERGLRNFPYAYSDEHSHLLLGDVNLRSGDILRYEIRNNQREIRYLEHVLP